MNAISFYISLFVFFVGVIAAYFIPDSAIPLAGKFVFVAAWGGVIEFVVYTIYKRKVDEIYEESKAQQESQRESPKTEYVPVVPTVHAEEESQPSVSVKSPFEEILPPEEKSEPKKALEKITEISKPVFPLESWDSFCRKILKNRPFQEVASALESALPQLFPGAAGVLYMYGDVQTELHKIFSFGDYVVSDDTIMPAECASFNKGEIVVSDFAAGNFGGGCTHLHHHPQGVSFCAPIEGIEEHFGILTIQVDKIPEGETLEFWKAKVSIVAATFGLYVANQNLNIRFKQHSIRDNLTGLFNRRYMEESLRREISAAARHKSPIGIIMLYPDSIGEIQQRGGRHAVEQLLWELGQRLPNYIRNEDIPCRYNGDVFCVILPGADLKITKDRAEKIRYEISQLRIAYGDTILETSLSLGVSVFPVHATDVSVLTGTAEMAMQMASSNGGNRVILADALQQD